MEHVPAVVAKFGGKRVRPSRYTDGIGASLLSSRVRSSRWSAANARHRFFAKETFSSLTIFSCPASRRVSVSTECLLGRTFSRFSFRSFRFDFLLSSHNHREQSSRFGSIKIHEKYKIPTVITFFFFFLLQFGKQVQKRVQTRGKERHDEHILRINVSLVSTSDLDQNMEFM